MVTATQGGFAAGLVLVVPLADITARRTLFTVLLLGDAAALTAMAVAPSLPVLAAAAVPVGLATVVVQMIIPFAATLASDAERGHVISTVMGGLLLGVLLSRTTAGLVASVAGWRGVYALAAALTLGVTAVLWRVLPRADREVGAGYFAQLRAVALLARRSPVLRWRAVMGAAQFAVFSCFWTTVTFLLAGRSYGYSAAAIGLFALVGAAGAACALAGGRQLDRHRAARWGVTGVAFLVMLGSFGLLAAGAHGTVGWLIAGALVMDACCQVVHVTNQAVIYDLTGSARARTTTVYMTTYFAGGALGTTLGTAAYARYGWYGACCAAAMCCGVGLAAWCLSRRHEVAIS